MTPTPAALLSRAKIALNPEEEGRADSGRGERHGAAGSEGTKHCARDGHELR